MSKSKQSESSAFSVERIVPRFLKAESIIAGPNYNRWLFPPAALLIQLSIGQAYAFSVFNKPLTKICPKHSTTCHNWNLVEVGWVFTTFFIMCGASAALFGRHLEKLGPRFSGTVAALCWGGGYMVSSHAVKLHVHSLHLLYLGTVISGIGIGCGYISPVSTLLKWFPDRPGLATGLAIAGFGGGAVIGAPLGFMLLAKYHVDGAFLRMGGIYMAAMLVGAMAYRMPPEGWKPAGWTPPPTKPDMAGYVSANGALRTPQFWLLWIMLCMNVSCGLGVIGQESLMIQEMTHKTPQMAAGIIGLLSLFNIGGRLLWSTFSDHIGRWAVYIIYFAAGIALYGTLPTTSKSGFFTAFFACLGVILSMYGGGFSAIPAYISDLFGVKQAGAIHGRVLTAWSAAAVVGPYMLNSIREGEARRGRPVTEAYDKTLYVLCILLAIGLLADLAMPVVNKVFPIKRKAPAAQPVDIEMEEVKLEEGVHSRASARPASQPMGPAMLALLFVWWSVPLIGFSWGLYHTILKGMKAW